MITALKKLHIGKTVGGVVVLAVSIALVYVYQNRNTEVPITATVELGTVSHVISVSGTLSAINTAHLSFPIPGIVESVSVHEGDVATEGDTLAALIHNDLKASYQDALGALRIAEADRRELLTGIRPEERDIAKTKVQIAEEDLARITKEQDDRVASAYRALLSTDIEATPLNKETDETAPTITGTFTCTEGSYTLTTFSSSAKSGYSFRLTGLETGTFSAYTDTAGPLGACGLSIQFTEGDTYGNSKWEITIPNTKSASYVTNKNAYTLAQTIRASAIREAEQALELAKQNSALDTATPRSESVAREDARVAQAQARLNQIDAQIQDHILTAPFSGVVTDVHTTQGESIGTETAITLVAEDNFKLTALIPEIDITKITAGQKAHVVFDAQEHETLDATITFISPLAREIDGVSYFEATLTLDAPASWLRSGLSADIHIITEERQGVLRVPQRFLTEVDGAYTATLLRGETRLPQSVTVLFEGNDGYAHIEGLAEGDVIIAP